jgi:DNA repair exonuclease SbcCD ATPase subunit
MLIENLEDKIEKNEMKLKALVERFEHLESTLSRFFEEHQISPEQLTSFFENPNNFNKNLWSELQEMRQQLDDKLKCEMENIHNPLKVKKTYADLNVASHWIFVR